MENCKKRGENSNSSAVKRLAKGLMAVWSPTPGPHSRYFPPAFGGYSYGHLYITDPFMDLSTRAHDPEPLKKAATLPLH
eukprot:7453950-Pyramimonas_sp.AAC.1